MPVVTVGVLAETAPRERRVALDPSAVARLIAAHRTVMIETGAGLAASFPDAAYTAAGGVVAARDEVVTRSAVLAVVRPPEARLIQALSHGQVIIGLLDPLNQLASVETLAARGVTAVALELLPRTLSRAQSMDALSSQANAAGYRAAVVAAEAFGRYLPMMTTAAGTAVPAKAIVIGTGVAGLQAIATLGRLGAMVTGYDVRTASRREVESLGATFLTSSVAQGLGEGGYARAMTAEEQLAQQSELASALTSFDIIVTTAKVPGRRPPVLVSAQTLAALRCGSVCVDLGASDQGGNVAGSVDGQRILTPGGVIVVGAGELACELPTSASQMYGRNVVAVIASLIPGNEVVVDPSDEVHRSVVISHGGTVTNASLRKALALDPVPSQDSLIEAKTS